MGAIGPSNSAPSALQSFTFADECTARSRLSVAPTLVEAGVLCPHHPHQRNCSDVALCGLNGRQHGRTVSEHRKINGPSALTGRQKGIVLIRFRTLPRMQNRVRVT